MRKSKDSGAVNNNDHADKKSAQGDSSLAYCVEIAICWQNNIAGKPNNAQPDTNTRPKIPAHSACQLTHAD